MQQEHFIDEVIEYCRDNRMIIESELGVLTEEEINLKPAPDRWSIAECISHINNSGNSYKPQLEKIVAYNKGGNNEIKNSLMGRLLLKFIDPDNVKKSKHPSVFNPEKGEINKAVFTRYYEWNDYFISFIEKSRGNDLNRIKISSPALKLLKFNLADILLIISRHERRHIKQAIRVKKNLEERVI
jgi:hypothetical protein